MKKFILERHKYSPEQNRIHFANGVTMKTPGCKTIADVKKTYFKQPKTYVMGAKIQVKHVNPRWTWLDKVYSGRVSGYGEPLAEAAKLADKVLPVPFTSLDGVTHTDTHSTITVKTFKRFV